MSLRTRLIAGLLALATVGLLLLAGVTYAEQRHRESLIGIKGYCRIRTTDQVVEELRHQARAAG